jgi:hypothetical protein
MSKYLILILDWSEVWATLIPLFFLLIRTTQPPSVKPIIIYIWLALFINLCADIIDQFYKHLPNQFRSNTFLYDILSIVRFACFAYFFILIQRSFLSLKKILALAFPLFIIINFYFFETFKLSNPISGNLLAAESLILLIYCMLYYLYLLGSEDNQLLANKDFWIVTGLSIYVVINFFVFLFYNPMFSQNQRLVVHLWSVHNIAYITLCIFIAKAFYVRQSITEYID